MLARISITTGDIDGIGTEVASKALGQIGPQKNVQFVLWRSSSCPGPDLKRLDQSFQRISISSLEDVPKVIRPKELIDICSDLSPEEWIKLSAEMCLKKKWQGLVTGPLSKSAPRGSRKNQSVGHTEILAKVSGSKSLYMAFLGPELNVVLATGHIPLAAVPSRLSRKLLTDCILKTNSLRLKMSSRQAQKPIGLVGLNPHAGENGLIGKEERLYLSLIKSLQKRGLHIEGPLVPDVAFQKDIRSRYSFLIASYHDQGLIPFKALHGPSRGVHLTLGLPFVRTSVDHGTAKDIFAKDLAHPGSMIDALNLALELIRK